MYSSRSRKEEKDPQEKELRVFKGRSYTRKKSMLVFVATTMSYQEFNDRVKYVFGPSSFTEFWN